MLASLDVFDLNSLAAENWTSSLDVAVLCHQQRQVASGSVPADQRELGKIMWIRW